MTLRLGVVGLSEGNGHPYSWSAIFNGYDPNAMQDCGFPVIPEYLARRQWPRDRIGSAVVTHVWTQSDALSRRIAEASLIPSVAGSLEEMAESVDAVLLARDDAENHLRFATHFLAAGLPVYIDKPIALSLDALHEIYREERFPGQIFTCSALRYAKEMKPSRDDLDHVGEIRSIHAITPKSWSKYAVHIIEPTLEVIGLDWGIDRATAIRIPGDGGSLQVLTTDGVVAQFVASGDHSSAPIALRVVGTKGWKEYEFTDAFSAFKYALQDFVDGVMARDIRSHRQYNERVVELIEAGLNHE